MGRLREVCDSQPSTQILPITDTMPDRAAHVQFLLLIVLGELALSLSETPAEPHAPEEAAPQAEASPGSQRRKRKRRKFSIASSFLDKLGVSQEAKTVLCAVLLIGLFLMPKKRGRGLASIARARPARKAAAKAK